MHQHAAPTDTHIYTHHRQTCPPVTATAATLPTHNGKQSKQAALLLQRHLNNYGLYLMLPASL
jgi:hypothetical protein